MAQYALQLAHHPRPCFITKHALLPAQQEVNMTRLQKVAFQIVLLLQLHIQVERRV